MSTFCSDCGKELGFFSRKHKISAEGEERILCTDCHRTFLSQPPQEAYVAPPPPQRRLSGSSEGTDFGQDLTPPDRSHGFSGNKQGPCALVLSDVPPYTVSDLRLLVAEVTGLAPKNCELLLRAGAQMRTGISRDYAEHLVNRLSAIGVRGRIDNAEKPFRQVDTAPPGTLVIRDKGDNAISLIKLLREATGLGLKEAKELADGRRTIPLQLSGGDLDRLETKLLALHVDYALTVEAQAEDDVPAMHILTFRSAGKGGERVYSLLAEYLNLSPEDLYPLLAPGARFALPLSPPRRREITGRLAREGADFEIQRAAEAELATVITGVRIEQAGSSTIEVIKVIRQVTELGLKEARDLACDGGSFTLAGSWDEARLQQLFGAAGARITCMTGEAPLHYVHDIGDAGAAFGKAAAPSGSAFDVILEKTGPKKISVIKELRSITGLGLKEAKDLSEQKGIVLHAVGHAEAVAAAARLSAEGASVNVRPS